MEETARQCSLLDRMNDHMVAMIEGGGVSLGVATVPPPGTHTETQLVSLFHNKHPQQVYWMQRNPQMTKQV